MRMPAGALADEEPLRPPREPEHARVDQRVVQHQIGRAQARHGLACQEPGSPGPAPTSETCPGLIRVTTCHIVLVQGVEQQRADAIPLARPSRRQIVALALCLVDPFAEFIAASTSSSASRKRPVSPGAAPSVEIAIVTPSRRTTPLRYALALRRVV